MGEKTEKIGRIEKNKGRTMNEIILDMEKGTGSASQVGRILDNQTEMMAKRLERSNMEQLMAEAERKRIEEEMRLKQLRDGQAPPPIQPPQASQEAKTILDAVRVGVEVAKPQKSEGGSLGEIVKGMADMFKTGVEIGRGQNQPQQAQQTKDPMEVYKVVSEIVRPFQEEARTREKEANELRYKELESKIINPVEYVKNIKTMASDLGLTSGGKSEIDLRLLEMAQTERIENRKIDFATQERQEKREEDKESTKQLYNLVGQVVGADGIVGKLTSTLGAAAKTRIERGGAKPNNPNLEELDLSKITTITCPKCAKPIRIFEGSTAVLCSNCDAVLGRQTQPQQAQQPQPQEQPSVTQPEETQVPPPQAQTPPTQTQEQPPTTPQPAEAPQPEQQPSQQ